jgi:drug/metabolite transporter (DMT)-like permease
VALACAVGGITLMVGAPGGSAMSPIGILLALAAAVVYALYIPLMGVRQRGLPALGVSHAVAVGGTFWFLVWGAGTGALLAVPTLRGAALSVAMGVLTTFAFFGFLTGLAGLGPVRAAITSTVEPLWTVLLGVLLLDQTLGTGALIGGVGVLLAVICCCVPVAWRDTSRWPRPAAPRDTDNRDGDARLRRFVLDRGRSPTLHLPSRGTTWHDTW